MYQKLYHGEKKRKVLVVDDEYINREILGNMLCDTYEVIYASDGQEALDKLDNAKGKISLVLTDLMMPGLDGFGFLEKYKEDKRFSNIPVIVCTQEDKAEVESIKKGAVDFITKPYNMPEVILARCERVIDLFESKELIDSTEVDDLTGLFAREFFFEYIRQLKNAGIEDDMDAVVLDVEHFHLINEIYGHNEGDFVLKKIAEHLKEELEGSLGIACRAEADTFYIYMEREDDYQRFINNITKKMTDIRVSPANVRIRMGINSVSDIDESPQSLFEHARLASNLVRGDFTKQIGYYDKKMYDKHIYNEKLVADFDKSIKNKDFVVYYQPKYTVLHGDPMLNSAEALVRWNHPTLGMISPGDFIPLFEDNGLIQKLDQFVWKTAAEQVKEWKNKFGLTIPVSVNVSRIDIYNPELEDLLTSIVKTNGLKTDELFLEITESAYADDATKLIEVVKSLRDKGFEIEMDDFGTGYSSLNMLTDIPIDALKMDMSFVRSMLNDDTSLKLVELIIDISKFLDVPVIAEGVETEEQLNTLKELECDIIQGYYFSKPVPAEEFEEFIKAK